MTPQAAPRADQDGPGAVQAFFRRIDPRTFAAGPIPYNYSASPITGSHGRLYGLRSRRPRVHAARWTGTVLPAEWSTFSDHDLRSELWPTEPVVSRVDRS